MLTETKLAMRITTNAYDNEINRLIAAACADLGIVDVEADVSTTDPLLQQAIITYVRLHFGTPEDAEYLQRSYDEQKAQLISNSDYGLRGWIG
jgi:hypothetical protein